MNQAFIILLLISQSFGVQLHNADKVEAYINKLIDDFEKTPRDYKFSSIITPPLTLDGLLNSEFFLPKVLLWSPQEHFGFEIKCPIHGTSLRPLKWTNTVSGKKDNSEARLIYDIQGNVILVQRLYQCTNGRAWHKLRSTSPDVLKILPGAIQAFFPVEIFQRSGCSRRLLQYIETQIVQGVSFLKISEGLAHLNLQEFCRLRNIYLIAANENNVPNNSSNCYEFYNNILFSFPSNDLIMNLFLEGFNRKKHLYEKEMNSLTATALSSDHTFKISRNVGVVRETDNKFVTQFKQLFIALNERGEVIAWKPTTTTAFSEIEDLLSDLKRRLDNKGNKLDIICVDDCCHVKNQYHRVFPNVDVKLDLFHACQRIVRTFPLTNALRKDIVRNFTQIFRQDQDQDKERRKHTPEKEKIEQTLNCFIERWEDIPSNPITRSTLTEIECLRNHIRKGCLSNIPPSFGTEKNEQLHRLLNRSLVSGATRISTELFVALLTILFYYHNKKIAASAHSCNRRIKPVVPIEAAMYGETSSEYEMECPISNTIESPTPENGISNDNCEVPVIHSSNKGEEPFIIIAETIKDVCNETVAGAILNSALNLQEMVENVEKKSCNRAWYTQDLIFLNSSSDMLVIKNESECNDPTINSHLTTLERHLAGFGLQLDRVPQDGDCAFRSVVRQLNKRAATDEVFQNHMASLQISADEDSAAFFLRQLFVNRLSKGETNNFICGATRERSQKIEEFRAKGVFDCDIGDLVMRVCSNILKVPIVVVTSNPAMAYVPFFPDEPQTKEPIYVAYHFYGAGHYDATNSITDDINRYAEQNKEASQETGKICHCGRKSKMRNQFFCNSGSDIKKSRCPCTANERMCTTSCRCFNCTNRATPAKKKEPSCRCGEFKKAKSENTTSCTDTIGRRRTKCPCFKEMKGCNQHCLCKGCENDYGRKESGPVLNAEKRQKKCTSSPSSLKRKRGSKFHVDNEITMNDGPWTLQETCVLETVMSFLCSTCLIPSDENIIVLYNYVLSSPVAFAIKVNSKCKSKEQVKGKLEYSLKRQEALERIYHGVAALQ